jgi:iron complex outermembrane receptor protein
VINDSTVINDTSPETALEHFSLLTQAEGFSSMRRVFYCLYFLVLGLSPLAVLANTVTTIPPVVLKAKAAHAVLQHPSGGASRLHISQRDIARSGVDSVPQLLQTLGGIQLQDPSGNGTQSVLSMRGFGSNATSNTLILVNGIPITNPDLSAPNLNFIPVQDIQFVEIVAGSESVLYGDQAVGGVVNIVTHPKLNDKVSLLCSGGSYNQRACTAVVAGEYQKLQYGLQMEASHTDNYRDHNDYNQALLTGNVKYRYGTGNVSFDTTLADEYMLFPGALTAAEVRQNRRQASNETNYFRDWTGYYHVRDEQALVADWQLDTDLFRREMHGHGVLSSPFTQGRVSYFLKPAVHGVIRNVSVTGGVELQSDYYNLNTLYGSTVDNQQQYGLFGLANTRLTERVSLSVGLRAALQHSVLRSYANLDTLNRALAATLGLTYKITSGVSVYLRRAGSFRFPKADENADVAPGVDGLRTQRGVSYETGVKVRYRQSMTQVSLYQLNLRDEITFDPLQTPTNPFGVNANFAPTVRYGFGLSEKWAVSSRVSVGGQYNFVNARFRDGIYAGKRIPLVAENTVLANVNYAVTNRWRLYGEALYTGSEYADSDNGNVAGLIGGYTVYNVGVHYQYERFTGSFRVNNVFDKDYYVYAVYQPTLQSEFFYPAVGRNFMVSLRYAVG